MIYHIYKTIRLIFSKLTCVTNHCITLLKFKGNNVSFSSLKTFERLSEFYFRTFRYTPFWYTHGRKYIRADDVMCGFGLIRPKGYFGGMIRHKVGVTQDCIK